NVSVHESPRSRAGAAGFPVAAPPPGLARRLNMRRPAGTKPAGRTSSRYLFDRERLVDQLLAVRYVLFVQLVGRLLGERDPRVIVGIRERHHLHLVVLELLDR